MEHPPDLSTHGAAGESVHAVKKGHTLKLYKKSIYKTLSTPARGECSCGWECSGGVVFVRNRYYIHLHENLPKVVVPK